MAYKESTTKLNTFKIVRGEPPTGDKKYTNSNQCTVSPEMAKEAPVGSVINVNGNKYLVVGVDKETTVNKGKSNVTVYMPNNAAYVSSTQYMTTDQKEMGIKDGVIISGIDTAPDAAILKDTNTNADVDVATGGTNSLKDGTPVVGAGVNGEQFDEGSIMDFATFLTKLAFRAKMDSSFNASGTTTVHDYVARNMQRFYHQLYYIPNLRDNYAIIVKPETLFIYAPSCNIIYPNLKSSLSYTRDLKREPTRIIQISDPVSGISGGASGTSGVMNLTCVLLVDEERMKDANGNDIMRNEMPLYKQYVVSTKDFTNLTAKKANPMTAISAYEKRNGIHGTRVQQGGSTYLYLTMDKSKTQKGKVEHAYAISSSGSDDTTVGNALAKLARYELIRQRYQMRGGSVSMYFNPYIVPGFPFVSLESHADGCNIYGYVTAVAHSLSAGSWSTTVSFNCAHMDNEQSPVAFPIVEVEYSKDIANTYSKMLGEPVKPVNNADVPALINEYYNGKRKVSTSLRKIWRPTASLDSYLEKVADGATLVQEKGFCVLQNGDKGKFFDEELQARLRKYSSFVMSEHKPYTNDDVK